MTINIILQARTSSTRLPEKVLKDILGKPMLVHQLERLKSLTLVDKIIVATSNDASDDVIEQLCQSVGIHCFRGSLANVLDRYYQASLAYPSDHVVRITGDCPVIDTDIIEQVIQLHLNTAADYSSNCDPATLPDGLDVEVFTFSALQQSWQHAKKPSELEHVTPFMRSHPELFTCQNYTHSPDYSHLRWTVDEPADFELITQIYHELYPNKPMFKLKDMLKLIEQKPHLAAINAHFKRNEGLLKSLQQDKLSCDVKAQTPEKD